MPRRSIVALLVDFVRKEVFYVTVHEFRSIYFFSGKWIPNWCGRAEMLEHLLYVKKHKSNTVDIYRCLPKVILSCLLFLLLNVIIRIITLVFSITLFVVGLLVVTMSKDGLKC